MINGIAPAGVLAIVLLLQLTVICGCAHQMHKVSHDNKGGTSLGRASSQVLIHYACNLSVTRVYISG